MTAQSLATPNPESWRARISTPVQVMYFDTDAGGVVHNIAYLRFIETARTQLALKLGMSFEFIRRTNIHPVVTRTEIDYVRPALLGDELLVEGGLGEVGGARFWVEFVITRGGEQKPLVTCRQCLALVQMPQGKVLRLPKGFPEGAPLLA